MQRVPRDALFVAAQRYERQIEIADGKTRAEHLIENVGAARVDRIATAFEEAGELRNFI